MIIIKDPLRHDSIDPCLQYFESDSSGYIYIIQDIDSGLLKISYIKN